MREIKFRAWDSKAKRMIIFDDFSLDNTGGFWGGTREVWCLRSYFAKGKVGKDQGLGYFHDDFAEPVDKYELMQYTGLKDNKGVEIYEGDILDTTQVAVEFKDGCFIIPNYGTLIEYLHSRSRRGDTIEVIGNIYQNKELLI